MPNIVKTKKKGIVEYPVTVPEAVIDENNISLKAHLVSINNTLNNKTDKTDLSNYYTKTEIDKKIEDINIGEIDLAGYATEEYVSEYYQPKGEYLTSIPEEYITEIELSEKEYLTNQDITGKQDVIEDLESIRDGAIKGATALQEVPEEYITNEELEAKGYLTEHQDISGKANISDLSTVATSGSYDDLLDKPSIPNEVTESTISNWGFTKNVGNYTKPDDGIPYGDLDVSVQTSLDKADTAIQNINYTINVISSELTSVTLAPNVYYTYNGTALNISFEEPSNEDVINEYVIDINCSTSPTISFPTLVKWSNNQIPEFTEGSRVVISIINNLAVFAKFDL